jgi:predicted transglutaminase-like cysteine proteinase
MSTATVQPAPDGHPWAEAVARLVRLSGVILLAAGIAAANPGSMEHLRALARDRYGPGGVDAVAAWQQVLESATALPEAEQLERVNSFFNRRIRFEDDRTVWGQTDYWATPLETLGRGAGDCEDFTIAKYASLLALGLPREKLRLVYVRALIGDPRAGIIQAHMVLGYYATPTAEPLVLDNLLSEIRPASRRPDLFPVFSFNDQGLWLGGPHPVADATARLSRWRDLLSRMAAEGTP